MRQIVFRHQARSELDKAGDWYERELAGLGLEFFAEINRLLQHIANNPEQFPVLYRGTRKAVARRFPYCVYFRERNHRIVVVAVFHSARNPAVWKSRIK
ncbi:MAG: type II toxin-antitoxin system RelE/ParE family toxin [Gallionella sp.]|nr:type II toxin-antitoxin system RelE/ParE family toxin [Gallionella sp.]